MTLTSADMGDEFWSSLAEAILVAYKQLPDADVNAHVTFSRELNEFRVMVLEPPDGPEIDVTPPETDWGRLCARVFRQFLVRRMRSA